MQVRRLLHLGLIGFLCAYSIVNAIAQEGEPVMRTNERGERIIVHPDGSWQYFHNGRQGSEVLFDPKDAATQQQQQHLERYPVFSGRVMPFEETIPITAEDAQKIAVRKAQLANSAAAIAKERAKQAEQYRSKLEAELEQARQQNQSSRIRALQANLEAAREGERMARSEFQRATVESARADNFVARGNYLSELKADQKRSESAALRSSNNPNLLSGNFYEQLALLENRTATASAFNQIPPAPPQPPCRLAYEGKDEYTGLNRLDVQKRLLFTHTDEQLRLYLKDKDYLRCEGFMTSLAGGYRYLSLEFSFAYPNAREAYGFIEKGSHLVIKLLDGQAVYLQSGKMDRGSYDTEKEILTYRVHYPINQGVLSTLRKGEIDAIRMYWSSGFEEYEVYYLNFFKDQIDCLERNW